MTKLINLIAGPGCGKSTTAAGLFYEMKKVGFNCELVQEYAKELVWSGQVIKPIDQPGVFTKQTIRETRLIGKVDYIITDSPALLALYYAEGTPYCIRGLTHDYYNELRKQGVVIYNFMLERTKKYNPLGRYQTEDQARQIDTDLKRILDDESIPYSAITGDQDSKLSSIYDTVTLNPQGYTPSPLCIWR